MEEFQNILSDFFSEVFGVAVPTIRYTDIVEILIIAYFIYRILVWVKNTRAWMLFRGILFVMAFFVLAWYLQMNTILWLGEKLLSAGVIALIVVFQPELRRALESLGRRSFSQIIGTLTQGRASVSRFDDHVLNDLVKACFEMGAVKTGALIAVEKEVQLGEYERTGIPVDALLTRQLLINIFEKNTPLHDGAIIVRGDRVVAATCYLPLTDNLELSKDLGTRHRAAVGLSEVSDAVVIVVSEETGKVSVACDTELCRDVTPETLTQILKNLQQPENANKDDKKGIGFFERRSRHEEV
ncbi:MAG: diadenylate cyclase CdaA [Lachnospiraceae bacterium]|nr:diadenylate cyclase CdaA [Lachnospiraceae bacterium]